MLKVFVSHELETGFKKIQSSIESTVNNYSKLQITFSCAGKDHATKLVKMNTHDIKKNRKTCNSYLDSKGL